MNKAFVREDDRDDDDTLADDALARDAAAPPVAHNYITPEGHARLRAEFLRLVQTERPDVVRTVSWAASNGDRSENGDYLYGKKRLREIDRRLRFLTRRLDAAVVVDPAAQHGCEQVFFGATVTFLRNERSEETVTIVGIDEVDPAAGKVSWISPIARSLLKSREGDQVSLRTPAGVDMIEILSVSYPSAT